MPPLTTELHRRLSIYFYRKHCLLLLTPAREIQHVSCFISTILRGQDLRNRSHIPGTLSLAWKEGSAACTLSRRACSLPARLGISVHQSNFSHQYLSQQPLLRPAYIPDPTPSRSLNICRIFAINQRLASGRLFSESLNLTSDF